MNDSNKFKHGDEGTHSVCNKRSANEGGKSRCCYCVPHEGCESMTNSSDCKCKHDGCNERRLLFDSYCPSHLPGTEVPESTNNDTSSTPHSSEPKIFVWPSIFRAIGPGDDMVVSAEKLREYIASERQKAVTEELKKFPKIAAPDNNKSQKFRDYGKFIYHIYLPKRFELYNIDPINNFRVN